MKVAYIFRGKCVLVFCILVVSYNLYSNLHVKFKGINPNVKGKNSSSGIRPSNSQQKFVGSNFKFPASNSSFDKANAFDFAAKGEAGVSFIPNLGQIANEDGTKSNDVLFSANSNGVNVFLRNTGVSYVFSNESEITHRVRQNLKQLEKSGKINSISKLKKEEELFNKEILKTHRVDMEMLGANKFPVTVNENETEGYINFYNQNCTNGILNVKEYKNITYKDVYQDIDVAYYSNDKNGLKYDFIVRPNANANQIKLHWKYANSIKLNNKGLLEIETELGVFHESIPKVYQEINGNIIEVDAKYKLLPDENLISNSKTNNNEVIVGFQLGNYNHAYPLIIDPWATYFGGAGDDAFENLATNTNGDVYLCGIITALSVITTPGAHQTVYGGGAGDALVTKFDVTGTRIWTTYYGGLKRDYLVSIAVAPTGDIYTCGRTNSINGISTVGSHQTAHSGGSFAGSYECVLLKMDAAGTRIWATYYGGTDGAEQANDVAVDLAGNIYMCGLTDSNNGIATSGSGEHQSSFGGTLGIDEDGFLAKFNSSGTRLWATYYGGPDPENFGADFYGIDPDAFKKTYKPAEMVTERFNSSTRRRRLLAENFEALLEPITSEKTKQAIVSILQQHPDWVQGLEDFQKNDPKGYRMSIGNFNTNGVREHLIQKMSQGKFIGYYDFM